MYIYIQFKHVKNRSAYSVKTEKCSSGRSYNKRIRDKIALSVVLPVALTIWLPVTLVVKHAVQLSNVLFHILFFLTFKPKGHFCFKNFTSNW